MADQTKKQKHSDQRQYIVGIIKSLQSAGYSYTRYDEKLVPDLSELFSLSFETVATRFVEAARERNADLRYFQDKNFMSLSHICCFYDELDILKLMNWNDGKQYYGADFQGRSVYQYAVCGGAFQVLEDSEINSYQLKSLRRYAKFSPNKEVRRKYGKNKNKGCNYKPRTLVDICAKKVAKRLEAGIDEELEKKLAQLPYFVHDAVFSHVKKLENVLRLQYKSVLKGKVSSRIELKKIKADIEWVREYYRLKPILPAAPVLRLIKAFEELETLEFSEPDSYEKSMHKYCLYSARPSYGRAIVDREQFGEQFEWFTNGVFKKDFDWSNCAVIGGCVAGALMPLASSCERTGESVAKYYQDNYPLSDIDIAIYGLSLDEFNKKLEDIYRYLTRESEKVAILRSTKVVVFVKGYPYRNIQIVRGKWESLQNVLAFTDIDCTGVAYDGKEVYMTARARLAFTKRWSVVDIESSRIRGSPKYEERLCKYALRGFSIADPFYDEYQKAKETGKQTLSQPEPAAKSQPSENTEENDSDGEDEDEEEDSNTPIDDEPQGYEFVEKFEKDPNSFSTKWELSGIPYGPKWSLEEIITHVEEKGYVEDDGYGTPESGYYLSDVITDEYCVLHPEESMTAVRWDPQASKA
eukprot:TRINITY_DN4154_c0_g1_i1.p1 TRINITY_DN4154_c0_g1~~TRINITY_DN4154_c0_g1_i1.p1  ORF type:complete len:638 (+),score=100.36 TRINITY_DN4154_c0_g1_i1:56-1969(+)